MLPLGESLAKLGIWILRAPRGVSFEPIGVSFFLVSNRAEILCNFVVANTDSFV